MTSPAEINIRIQEAERECETQLELIRLLKHLTFEQRIRVMAGVNGLLDADRAVPGCIDAFLKGKAVVL